jgi:RNA polymerase sigma factor (sigma-70 family)
MNSEELCSGLNNGEKEAWIEGFDILYPVALNASSSFTYHLNSDEAEDVAMIAINAVYEIKDKPKNIQEFKSLTSSIAHRRSKDFLRSKLSLKRGEGKVSSIDKVMDENPGIDFAAIADDDLIDTDLSELSLGIKQLLQDLKEDEQKIVKEFFVNGKSHQEIADLMDMPKGSVGVKIKRSLDKLRKTMEENPELVKYLKVFLRCTPIVMLLNLIVSEGVNHV